MSARDAARALGAGLAASVLAAIGAASAQVQADFPLDMIPPEARALAQEAAPDAEFYEANLEVGDEQGHTAVEITGRNPQGGHVEVDLFETRDRGWQIEEIERHISWDETPAPVREAIASLMSRTWRPIVIERSDRPDGTVMFEIEGIDRYDERFELELTSGGDFIALSKFNAS